MNEIDFLIAALIILVACFAKMLSNDYWFGDSAENEIIDSEWELITKDGE